MDTGAAQLSGFVGAAHAAALAELAEAFAAPAEERALLDRLCGLLVELLPVVAAGLVVVDEELQPVVVASAPGFVRRLLVDQFASGLGPCVDACRTGRPVTEIAPAGQGLPGWPLPPTAPPLGWRAVHTLPVRSSGRVTAVVTLASTLAGTPADHHLDVARSVSAVGAGHVQIVRATGAVGRLGAQLQDALHGRIVIEQAKGMLAGQLGTSVEQAAAVLHHHAETHGQRLGDLAAQVVIGGLRLPGGPDPSGVTSPGLPPPARRDAATGVSGRATPLPGLTIIDTGTPGRVEFVGEADLSTLAQLAQAVDVLAAQAGDVIIDLARLDFLDVGSVGLLVRTAGRLGPPRRLLLRGATGCVARVLTLLQVDQVAQVHVLGAGEPAP